MRTKWLLIGIGLLVAVVATAAAACDDDENGGARELTATLSEMEGSGVTGTATLTETRAQRPRTQVVVTMMGLPEGLHANHLHHGTCDAQAENEVHVTLEELQAKADGDAEGTTIGFDGRNEDPGLDHFAVGHYIAVHVGGNDTVAAVIS